MRLVLDTNVVVSAMLWGGKPKLLLQARREKRVEKLDATEKCQVLQLLDAFIEHGQLRRKTHNKQATK